jgi:hypothetical protein
VARQYFLTNFQERLDHNSAAKDTKKIEKDALEGREINGKTLVNDKEARQIEKHKWYHPSIEEVSFNPVPFDITAGLEGLGGGFEHRAKTPGHDAILGYIFGTANIATSTLTTWEMQSFHVKYADSGIMRKPMITNNAGPISLLIEKTLDRLINEDTEGKAIVAISLFREAMHIKSDVNSKVSLPAPIITTISPDFAKQLAKYGFDVANIKTVSKQIAYATLINTIIAMLHRLMYDYNGAGNLSLYEVRTRKILSYSNLIATASNILIVSISSLTGGKIGKKYLDIGGLLVTIYRLISDAKFISQIKQEFLENEFYSVVIGDDFNF